MEELLRVKMEFKKYSLKIRQCRDRCRWAVLPAVRPQHERAGDREDEDRHVEGHRVAPDVEGAGDLAAGPGWIPVDWVYRYLIVFAVPVYRCFECRYVIY